MSPTTSATFFSSSLSCSDSFEGSTTSTGSGVSAFLGLFHLSDAFFAVLFLGFLAVDFFSDFLGVFLTGVLRGVFFTGVFLTGLFFGVFLREDLAGDLAGDFTGVGSGVGSFSSAFESLSRSALSLKSMALGSSFSSSTCSGDS